MTGLCAKCQRKVAKTIRRSRNFRILPHIGEIVIQDTRPTHEKEFVHDDITHAFIDGKQNQNQNQIVTHIVSKTIL